MMNTLRMAVVVGLVISCHLFYQRVSAGVVQVINGYDVTYPKGRIGGASPRGLPANYIPIKPPAKEYYLDYQVQFADDWEWVKGGKLPGLVGGKHTSGCRGIEPDGWSNRFMWRGGGLGQLYIYHQNRRSGCGDEWDFPSPGNFTKGKWNRLTEHVIINTPGMKDGTVEAWQDGKKVLSVTNLQLRGKVADNVALVDQVSLQTFFGGSSSSWAPPRDMHAKFSNFYVRSDLPDFSKSFDEGNEVSIRQVIATPGPRAGRTISWVYLGHGGLPPGLESGSVKPIRIFDARGNLVRSLAAADKAAWDGNDARGRPVMAGLLFVRPM